MKLLKFFLLATVALNATVLRGETAYFLFAGRASWVDGALFTWVTPESFVVPVSAPEQILLLRDYLARRKQGLEPRALIASLRLGLGTDGINRNYAQPGAPAWNWHVTAVLGLARTTGNAITADYRPQRDSAPSDIERLLRGEIPVPGSVTVVPGAPPTSTPPPPTDVNLIHYPLTMELSLTTPAKMSNSAARGFVGPGDHVLILGFAIEGGTPRNVILRALGPSLAAFGVAEPLAGPQLELYRDGVKIAANNSWIEGNLNLARNRGVDPAVPASPLAPLDVREPGLQLSLEPGTYTAVVRGVGGQSGTALLEFYCLDGVN